MKLEVFAKASDSLILFYSPIPMVQTELVVQYQWIIPGEPSEFHSFAVLRGLHCVRLVRVS